MTRAKRPAPVRNVSEEMLQTLKQSPIEARNELSSSSGFRMLSLQFVCPDSVIAMICADATHIKTHDDLNYFFLRPLLRDKLFSVFCQTVCDAPPPSKRGKRK